ncbi:hypothetical protein LINPERPRIM_LOCUS33597 [Linum perenne]
MVEVSILESLGSDNEQDGASRDNNSKDSIRSSLGKGMGNSVSMLNNSFLVSVDNSACFDHTFVAKGSINTWKLWHSRLGHHHTTRLQFMFNKNLLPDRLHMIPSHSPTCEQCISAKFVKRFFPLVQPWWMMLLI